VHSGPSFGRVSLYFDAFGVVLVEVADVERIGRVHFATRRNQRRRQFQQIDLFPVDVLEKRMLFDFFGPKNVTTNTG
jgi:hypothetical protein